MSPDDANFADTQKGWGWGNRCFAEIKQGKWGWARAACDKGLALPQVDAKARPALLYNEGLIAKHGGDLATARDYFTQSLELRSPDDPGRAEVEKELRSVGGSPPPPVLAQLECRAQNAGQLIELWSLSWDQNTFAGTLRTTAASGAVSSQPISALGYKGLILVNPAGNSDPTKRIATLQTTPSKSIQIGDYKQPWLPCQ